MTIAKFEEMILPKLKWNSIAEIPNFPIKDFSQLVNAIQNKKTFSLGIDYKMAKQVAPAFFNKGGKLLSLISATIPTLIIPILFLFLTFTLSNYWLLIGVILPFLSSFFASPYNHKKTIWNVIAILLCFVGIYNFIQNQDTLFYLIVSFVAPFFIIVFLNRSSWNKMKEVVLNSEKVFIYFYQRNELFLKNNDNNQFYTCP